MQFSLLSLFVVIAVCAVLCRFWVELLVLLFTAIVLFFFFAAIVAGVYTLCRLTWSLGTEITEMFRGRRYR